MYIMLNECAVAGDPAWSPLHGKTPAVAGVFVTTDVPRSCEDFPTSVVRVIHLEPLVCGVIDDSVYALEVNGLRDGL